MRIEKRTIEEIIYISEDGREQRLSDMNPVHLLNAHNKARDQHIESRAKDLTIVNVLREEILRRMGTFKND